MQLFIFRLPKINLDALLVTSEVTKLYSNISHELGKQAISFWIDKYPETLYPRFYKNFITDGIDLILNNYFSQFNNVNYILTLGTAIGTKMAARYATLTFTN